MELPNGCPIKLGTGLEPEQRDILTPTLVNNTNLFAWLVADLPGFDPQVASHKLSIYKEARYVSQKKLKLGEEQCLAAKAEADKLLNTGFIEEAHYTTWLSNVFLVKKANGKWRMCVDYTDLNKARPRDAYPLPNIDRLVVTRSSVFLMHTPIITKFPWPHPTEQNRHHHKRRQLLLQGHAIRSQKCRSNLLTIDGQSLQPFNGQMCRSIC